MNDIVQWDPNSGAALPAHIAQAAEDFGSNIQDRMSVPSLSYEGKVWAISKDGNKTKLQSTNQDGDLVPVSVMRAVILDFNPNRGRAYYPGVYNPAESKRPDCWSADGKTPEDNSPQKQASACASCPMSVKGSKVQDGKEMVACGQHRMIALVPANDISFDPLRLKIAVTSDWDKEVVEHGWFAFRQYGDFLKSRGISHTALVVTKMKFDHTTAFPKILFAIDRLLTVEEVEQAKLAAKNPKVAELLNETWNAAGVNGTPNDDKDIRPDNHGLAAAVADGWAVHPQNPAYHFKGQEVVKNEDVAARYPAPVAETPPPPTPAPPPPPTPAPPPPAPEPVKAVDPLEAAKADGWLDHPNSPPHMYRGQEVLAREAVAAKYAGNAAPPVTPAAPDGSANAATAADPASSTSGTTATSGASPSDGTISPEVSALLDKWN